MVSENARLSNALDRGWSKLADAHHLSEGRITGPLPVNAHTESRGRRLKHCNIDSLSCISRRISSIITVVRLVEIQHPNQGTLFRPTCTTWFHYARWRLANQHASQCGIICRRVRWWEPPTFSPFISPRYERDRCSPSSSLAASRDATLSCLKPD